MSELTPPEILCAQICEIYSRAVIGSLFLVGGILCLLIVIAFAWLACQNAKLRRQTQELTWLVVALRDDMANAKRILDESCFDVGRGALHLYR